MVTLRRGTIRLLTEFAKRGGKIIVVEPVPYLVEGEKTSDIETLLGMKNVIIVRQGKESLRRTLDKILSPSVQILDGKSNDIETIYYQERMSQNGPLYFFANTDSKKGYQATIRVSQKGCAQKWDLSTGRKVTLPAILKNGCTELSLFFPPAASHLILLTKKTNHDIPDTRIHPKNTQRIDLDKIWRFRRHNHNIMVLDNCHYKIERKKWSRNLPVWKVQKNLESSGKETCVSARYSFTTHFKEEKKREMYLVLENPDIYTIMINGNIITYKDTGWWVDISFKKINIAKYVKMGINTIEVHFKFKNPIKADAYIFNRDGVELENCYVIGDFAVIKEPDSRNFYLSDEKNKIYTGSLISQGYPFYAGSISYIKTVVIDERKIKNIRTFLEIDTEADVTKVIVNKKAAGTILWQPYRIEVTNLVKRGENTIEIEITNGLRNMLGPHHHVETELTAVSEETFFGGPPWDSPPTRRSYWTDKYNFIPFGIRGVVLNREE